MYSYLGSTPLLLNAGEIRAASQTELILEIADRWRGIPLKGPA